MRVLFVLTVLLLVSALPLLLGPSVAKNGSGRQVVWFSLGCLAASALGLVVALGAVVAPGTLPAGELPDLVGRCVDAAGELLEHPVTHWPRIAAALLLLGVVLRLIYATLLTLRSARRETRRLAELASDVPGDHDLLVVPVSVPFAFSIGILSRRIVASSGLLESFDPPMRQAVLAHERAHVRGWHSALLTAGRIVARAFPFLPPVRRSAESLVLGLEMSADEAAVRRVGDPLIVASALLRLTEVSAGRLDASLQAASLGIGDRVARLLGGEAIDPSSRRRTSATVALSAVLLLTLVLALPASARTLTGAQEARAFHAVCHLPHRAS